MTGGTPISGNLHLRKIMEKPTNHQHFVFRGKKKLCDDSSEGLGMFTTHVYRMTWLTHNNNRMEWNNPYKSSKPASISQNKTINTPACFQVNMSWCLRLFSEWLLASIPEHQQLTFMACQDLDQPPSEVFTGQLLPIIIANLPFL